MNLVSVRDLHKSYFLGGKELKVLRGLEMEIGKNETVAIVGPSGVGKSTLLHLIGALDRPSQGEIYLNGKKLWADSGKAQQEMARIRAEFIGFVFQFHHLLPEFSALENVFLAGLIRGGKNENQRRRAVDLLCRVGLSERLEHKPGELSGGEQQRVALARALMNHPPLILADEPTGNLDRDTAQNLQDLIFDLGREQGLSFLVVTHDLRFALRCDRILQLQDGKAIQLTHEDLSALGLSTSR